ncbi:DUF6814 family protein [Flavihumibacter petaseus]|uniref:Uncharacterized protein n=1 Tax=Flavihumibacter petaseus NBRC 106054 TaxID=1220578 RepID=A0A0E9MZF5_9BACT|nr:hypothetical protein [Flavihumibacter petaseus]GAO42893.1 hypothetical protein FPE01S_01_19110 [Flavihumibacter petaseus NBRC 106054]
MNTIRRYLGLVWMLLGPALFFLLLRTAMQEMQASPHIDTRIQWTVFLVVFFPISIGLMIFGLYAFRGEYDRN